MLLLIKTIIIKIWNYYLVLNVLVLSKIINITLNYNPIVTELNSITIHFYVSIVQSGDYIIQ